MNIFEFATRKKIRFEHKGLISTEDLWDLKLIDLDKIYKSLMRKQKETSEESLLNSNPADKILNTQIEIIKYIVSAKQEELKIVKSEKEKADKKQRIAEIIYDKQNEALKNLSIEELEKLLGE